MLTGAERAASKRRRRGVRLSEGLGCTLFRQFAHEYYVMKLPANADDCYDEQEREQDRRPSREVADISDVAGDDDCQIESNKTSRSTNESKREVMRIKN
jgi:hypothetical protein